MSTLDHRPLSTRPAPSSAPVNEWGMYDPAVAGIEALFARVDPEGLRREREPAAKRRSRPKKGRDETSGVGLAISEAIARARLTSAVALSPAELSDESIAPPMEVRSERATPARHVSRQPRSRPAIWLRASAEAVRARNEPDAIHGIFGTLAIPATVALVQYARGCRIGPIHIPGE